MQTPPAATTHAELWHARFGKATGNSSHPADEDVPTQARAVWTPDLNPNAPPTGTIFNTALDAASRKQLVQLSAPSGK